jgi:hypothetical protein
MGAASGPDTMGPRPSDQSTRKIVEVTPKSDDHTASHGARWAAGEFFGLRVPADLETLLVGGTDFLTDAFRVTGTMSGDNSVRQIVGSREFSAGGTGKKALLRVTYEKPEAGVPEELFIKFSRNFDNELWDSGRFQMISEVNFAVLSHSPDFPVPVPAMLFADVDPESGTGLIISERITYGRHGIEPLYLKCMDYNVPDQVGHYKAILRGLARLSGTHRAGKLSPDFDTKFSHGADHGPRSFGGAVPEIKVIQRATRMFDFIDRYPKLVPDNVRMPEFRQQFMRDIPDVVAAQDRISAVLKGNPDFFAFAHWNANIDNCWFQQGPDGHLQAGFLDWANAGQLSVAQSINGAINGAETFVWDKHLDELLNVFIDEYVAHGGPLLDLDELRLHILLMSASGLAHSMGAPIAIPREIDDIAALEGYRDNRFAEAENARIQLHMMTRMLDVWQTRKLGDLVRTL